MRDIVIKRLEKNIYRLQGVQQLSERVSMKLNIYLNAIRDISIIKNQDSIDIDYNLANEHTIAKSLKDITVFLESCKSNVELDSETESMLLKQKKFEQDSAAKEQSLKVIKAEDYSIKAEFSEFCTFCDNSLIIRLRDYQYKSAFLLSTGEGGFDFSVPGAGKTIITYATYAFMKYKKIVDSIFVIGPGSAFNAWHDEYCTCFGQVPSFENLSLESTNDCKLYLGASDMHHKEITFINFEKIRILKNEIQQYLSSKNALLIIDEGHKIKNPGAAVAEAVLGISKYVSARIILTGTPMPNGYEDLYSLTQVLSPFEQILPYRYNQLKSMTQKGATDKEINKIHESIDPYYSRISKKYLIEKGELLPYKVEVVPCKMIDEQQELYEKLNDFCGKLTDDIDEDFLTNLKKAILIRKMQISANPALLKKSIINSMDELKEEYVEYANKEDASINILAKADKELMGKFAESNIRKIITMFEHGVKETNKNRTAVELAYKLVKEGKKVLIWDIFVNNMEVLKSMLEEKIGGPVELINGTVSGDDRQQSLKRFREGNSMILLANPATLAESISLHKVCQNAIYVNQNFNAAQFIQSKDRIHRINMPEGTTAHYYFIQNEDSIDSSVFDRLKKKEKRMLDILDADDICVGGAEMEDSQIMSLQDISEVYMR